MSSPRVTLVLPVRFSYDVHAIQTTSQELSTEGALVRCLEPPPLGTELKLRFYLPGSQQVAEFTGAVRQIISGAESGFWADFTSSAPDARERLYSLIAAHDGGAWRTPIPIGAFYARGAGEPGSESAPGLGSGAPLEGQAAELPADPALSALSSSPNRRSFPRHRARFLVRFESVQEFVLQYAANISAGGVFINTDFPPAMESVITVSLELPGGSAPVTARAQVVHRVTPEQAAATHTDAGAGVQFIDADDAFREGIDRAIEFILSENAKAPSP